MPDVAISDFYSQRVVTIEPHPALLRLHLVEPADLLRSQLRHLVSTERVDQVLQVIQTDVGRGHLETKSVTATQG